MKKKKSLGPLVLNKTVISKFDMDEVKGGKQASLTIIIAVTYFYCTKGDCDMPTIGHDDGSYCLSKEADWCHGRK